MVKHSSVWSVWWPSEHSTAMRVRAYKKVRSCPAAHVGVVGIDVAHSNHINKP